MSTAKTPSCDRLSNMNVRQTTPVISPAELDKLFPVSEEAAETALVGRQEITDIMSGADNRFLVVVGPCSIHDPEAALEYANRLVELRERYKDRLVIVMRTYFEKTAYHHRVERSYLRSVS